MIPHQHYPRGDRHIILSLLEETEEAVESILPSLSLMAERAEEDGTDYGAIIGRAGRKSFSEARKKYLALSDILRSYFRGTGDTGPTGQPTGQPGAANITIRIPASKLEEVREDLDVLERCVSGQCGMEVSVRRLRGILESFLPV